MPTLPCRFGRYELVEELARGAHGIVYRARDLELGRTVALKLLRADATCSSVERFRREARVAARLRHPHIMDVFEAGEEDGRPFFTMPLVQGGPLAWAIHASPLDARGTARLLERVARAVHFAHERGVVHRDLKPTNVLLREDGTPVVTDFGIAHDDEGGPSLTQTGELLGTPMYMAPEQIAGRARAADARTDVYALGVLLYEMLARRPPFSGRSFVELSAQVLNDDPEPPSAIDPLVDPGLERICLKCLRKDPGGRYPTAAALADDLGRVARGEPVSVEREATQSRIARLVRKHRVVVAALVGAAVALTAGALARPEAAAPASAQAVILTDPPEASVYVDGRFVGAAPRPVEPGCVALLRAAGYAEAAVRVRTGENRVRLMRTGAVPEEMVYAAEPELFADRTEVTVAQYARFVEATGHRAPSSWKRAQAPAGDEALPVTGVSWDDAQAYAAWARKRLPTEAEWRALAEGAAGPPTCAPRDRAQAVATAPTDRSRAGCFDMLGNVQEWTATVGTAGPGYRLAAGGSWERAERECTIDRAEERRADHRARDLGFRCVLDPPWKK